MQTPRLSELILSHYFWLREIESFVSCFYEEFSRRRDLITLPLGNGTPTVSPAAGGGSEVGGV
jgi:hypothetical protein